MRLKITAALAASALACALLGGCATSGGSTAAQIRADTAKGLSTVEGATAAFSLALASAAQNGLIKGDAARTAETALKDLNAALDAAEAAYAANDATRLQAALATLKGDLASLQGVSPKTATDLQTALAALQAAVAVFEAAHAPAS